MRNRLVLFGLILGAWACLKVIDFLLPWPAICVLLCVTLAIMIAHTVWLLAAQRRGPNLVQAKVAEGEWLPSVDIFIPAKNESRVIEKTVRNFLQLDYPNYSVWVIDDASDDSTPIILQRLKEEFSNFKYLSRSPGSFPGKSAGLNDALPLSKAEVVVVFDADASVAPDFLKMTLPLLRPERVGAVQVQKKIYAHQTGMLPNCQASEYALDTYFQVGRDRIGGAVELRGNGELIKREALVDVGGWNNKAITDDLDLTMRLLINKWDVRFDADTCVYEEAVTTLKGLMRQRRRWAEGSIRRYLEYIFPLNSPSRLSVVERLDLLAFFSEFAVPGLMLLEVIGESINLLRGVPTHFSFLAVVAVMTVLISGLNFFIAIRIYRPEISLPKALLHNIEVNAYVYAHWLPCIMISFMRIVMTQRASKWHRTEHIGV